MDNEDKEKLSNPRKYDEELRMLEYWLINPRIGEDDCLILGCNIGEENKEGQGIELSCNDIILLQQLSTSCCRGMDYSTNSEEHFGIIYSRNMIANESKNTEDIQMKKVVGSRRELREQQQF